MSQNKGNGQGFGQGGFDHSVADKARKQPRPKTVKKPASNKATGGQK